MGGGKLGASVTVVVLLCAVFGGVFGADSYDKYKDVSGGSDVRHEMDSLVEGVKKAVGEAGRARDHKEVLDLGQSLHVLEHKFAGLKAAIAHEMGTKLPEGQSHGELAKSMIDSSTKLIEDVSRYRVDMQRLMVSMRSIDDSLAAIKDGMQSFDKEVDDMNRLLADLHVRTNELHENHHSSNVALEMSAQHLSEDATRHSGASRGSHKFYYFLLAAEIIAVAYYIYTKRNALPSSAKHYGKFG